MMIALSVGKWCLPTEQLSYSTMPVFLGINDLHEVEFALETTRVFSYLKFW